MFVLLSFISINSYSQEQTVKTIYFKSNSFTIDSKSKQLLNEIGRKCINDTTAYLKIIAYADTTGSIQHNSQLSEKRSLAVYHYLMKNFRLDAGRIYRTWLGEETESVPDLHFPEAHFQQRCVDVVVSSKNR